MTDLELRTKLEELGFHKQAILVYLSVLKNVQMNANSIAKDTGLPRSTVYLQTNNLIHQGLLASNLQNKTRYFTATPIKTLVDIAEKQLDTAQTLIPHLKELSHEAGISRPSTTLFVGKQAIRNVLDELLDYAKRHKETVFNINKKEMFELFPRFYSDWIKRRERMKIFTQIIAENDSKPHKDYSNTQWKEVHFLPKNFIYDGILKIVGDRILFISLDSKEVHAVQVDSPIIARMCRTLFQYMWSTTN
jgi:sugar-specific transcriptional regulator TrmB